MRLTAQSLLVAHNLSPWRADSGAGERGEKGGGVEVQNGPITFLQLSVVSFVVLTRMGETSRNEMN